MLWTRDRWTFPIIAVAFAALVGYLLVTFDTGKAQQTQTGEPLGYAIGPLQATVVQTTSAVQIISTNPTRRYIEICNPTTGTTVWIAPLPLTATTPQNAAGLRPLAAGSYPLFPIIAAASGTVQAQIQCYRTPFPPSNFSGGFVGAAWNAIAEGSNLGALTIFEY